jgi:hypothetical protein
MGSGGHHVVVTMLKDEVGNVYLELSTKREWHTYSDDSMDWDVGAEIKLRAVRPLFRSLINDCATALRDSASGA